MVSVLPRWTHAARSLWRQMFYSYRHHLWCATRIGPRTNPFHYLYRWFSVDRCWTRIAATPICRWQSSIWFLPVWCHIYSVVRHHIMCWWHVQMDAVEPAATKRWEDRGDVVFLYPQAVATSQLFDRRRWRKCSSSQYSSRPRSLHRQWSRCGYSCYGKPCNAVLPLFASFVICVDMSLTTVFVR